MVWESWYWKQRLKALSVEIEEISEQPDASTLDISNLEIAIFTGFFLIRKLIEAETKLSQKTENQSVRCRISSKKPDVPLVDLMNRFDIHKLYEIESFKKTQISLRKLCNIFTHSIFLWMVYETDGFPEGEGFVSGVHVTSTFDKDKLIYWVEISDILKIFRVVVNDKFDKLEMIRDPQTQEMKVKKS